MICIYETKLVAVCPVDGKPDVYDVRFESDALIRCEDIVEKVRQCANERVFQEAITSDLARHFGCKVVTTGYHSGIKTTVVAP